MDKLIDQLLESISDGNMIAFLVIVVASLIFNFDKIVSFLDVRKVIKIQMIEEAIKSQYVGGATKAHLKALIEIEYFKRITGIYLEKEVREALLRAHQESNGELKFKHYKRAIPHIVYKNNELAIKISKFSVAAFFYNLIFGFLLIISGIASFILPAFSTNITIVTMLTIYGVAAFMMAIGVWMVMEAAPVVSAKQVRRQLAKGKQNPELKYEERSMPKIKSESTSGFETIETVS